METPLSLAELDQRLRPPGGTEGFSALTGCRYLLLDLTDPVDVLNTDDYALLCNRLAQLPCPVLAITDQELTSSLRELSEVVDVVLTSEKAARSIINNIRNNPLTAATLVQLLRHNERASIADGLFAESLAYATLQTSAEFCAFMANRAASIGKRDSLVQDKSSAVNLTRAGDVLTITFNQPQQRNAFSIAVRDGLIEGLQLLATDSSISKAIVNGAGACFCTGGDLEEFGLADDASTAHAIRATRNAGRMIADDADRIEFHVHRACIGSGIELPAFAGRVVASADTLFQLPEITMGLIPGAGGTVSILKRIGRQRTAWLALSARRINAKTALDWGLIDEIE